MLIATLRQLFKRDLEKLRTEITLYQDEDIIWKVDKQIANCAGNLCLHIIGNLNAYLGTVLGNTGYIRDREGEFSIKGISRAELLSKITETIEVVDAALANLTEEVLWKEYPMVVFKDKMTTGHFLVHLETHLGYHLGQVNYHRRLLDV